jgi:hypothetical protein
MKVLRPPTDKVESSVKSFLSSLQRPNIMLGALLLLGSIIVTVVLGIRGTSNRPPVGVDNVLLLSFAAVLQIAAGGVLASDKRVNPAHARSAQRRVTSIVVTAQKWEREVELTLSKLDAISKNKQDMQNMQITLDRLGIVLGEISKDALDALLDWQEFDTTKADTTRYDSTKDDTTKEGV